MDDYCKCRSLILLSNTDKNTGEEICIGCGKIMAKKGKPRKGKKKKQNSKTGRNPNRV